MIINDPVKITGIVDILIIIIFTSLGFRGFLRGFIKEISGFAEVFVLILLLYKKTEEFRRFVEPIIELSYIQALLVFFLLIHIGFLILQSLIESIISQLKLLFFNRILGLVLGLLEAFGIIAIVVYIIHSQQIFKPEYFLKESKLLDYLNPGINYLFKISKTK
ncbi:CvpA family protein [Borreliella burgdorferi]|uniref:CvpA family protein n=4 Tax=Borreliella burgdorferi TaxID=139 RepID=O51707_BORBU|nr:CvpA family protein [Borreliella burgdorferi]AGS66761.1 colicin V production protein A (CvpA) [Borreliella burgdorferi CA382]EOA79857.1 CvpA family protein [Borreliella burgdorferi CA8]AAC67114.1 CvpA family protein [Borreliella burgdorferi B31]ABG56107.1 putative colicin V production protein [Borreliella burgdorferi]ABG56108.1 putative colicin V production protein [Borreliella burgdorferi]